MINLVEIVKLATD